MFNINFLFLNDYVNCFNMYKYIKYFFHFNHLLLYISYINIKKYYNITITHTDIDTIADLVKANGCLVIKFAQWYSSRLSINTDVDIDNNKKDDIETYVRKIFSDTFYDNNSLHSLEYTKKLFKKSTGNNIEDIVSFNTTTPISSGSIAQVYDCTLLKDGRRVAVKVKHPDLKYQILFPKIFINIAIFILNYFKMMMYFPFNLDNFFNTLYKQLDFNEESRNLKIFRENFSDSTLIIIPESLYNTYDIIIMSYEEGMFYEEIDTKICNNMNRFKINFTLFMFVMQCFLVDGINHSDLHNGNWKVRFNPQLNEYQVIIYDAGVVYHSNVDSMRELIYFYDCNKIDKFIKVLMRDKYITNLSTDNYTDIEILLNDRLQSIIQRPFDFSFIIFEIIDILKTQQLSIDGDFLTLIIGVSLVEKHFKKYKIMGNNDDTSSVDNELKKYDYDLICYNDYMERINFCDTKNNFKKLSDFFKFTLDKLKKEKRINSFENLNKNTQNIKFLDLSKFLSRSKSEPLETKKHTNNVKGICIS